MNAHRLRGERGAGLVEAALLLPLLLMIVLGIFSGASAWDRKQSLAHAGREATRYGATLPTGGNVNTWLDQVAGVAIANADGNLDASAPGRYLCVALVGSGSNSRRVVTGSGSPTYQAGQCFSDGLAGARVQTLAQRTTDLDALLHFETLTLTGKATTRFEAIP